MKLKHYSHEVRAKKFKIWPATTALLEKNQPSMNLFKSFEKTAFHCLRSRTFSTVNYFFHVVLKKNFINDFWLNIISHLIKLFSVSKQQVST